MLSLDAFIIMNLDELGAEKILLTLEAPTPQNDQTHSNHFVKFALKVLTFLLRQMDG